MRKVLLCLLGLLFVSGTKLYAYDFQSGGIYYTIKEGNNVAVTSGDLKYEGKIIIPEKVSYNGKSYNVTSIGSSAFEHCNGLTSITIPNSVMNIGVVAFRGCSGLTTITIPASVTTIGLWVFYGCSGLSSIKVENGNVKYDSRNDCNAIIETSTNTLITGCKNTLIPNTVKSLGDGAFDGCSDLTSITIPNSVTSLGENVFYDCSSLESISIPNSIKVIPTQAFRNCSSLTQIDIPNTVTSIGGWAFCGCTNLASLDIPNSVNYIGPSAFASTKWFNSQPNGLVYAGMIAYMYKGSMLANTNITLKDGTTGIAGSAFSDCTGLSSIFIPSSVTSIGMWAFSGCTYLTSITIPNKVQLIEFPISEGCSGLTSIKVESGNTIYDSRSDCNAIVRKSNNELVAGCKNTVVPNSVTSIGNYAFSYCTGLTSISIPNSVRSIGDGAFRGCSGLKDIISEIKTPFEINENVFSVYSTATLKVPNGTKSAYQSTASWNKFTNIVEASGDNSSTKRTIHVAKAGSLPDLISESEKYSIEELTLTGELNGTDFRLLRDMAGNNYLGQNTSGKLKVLDITNAKVVAGGEKYLDTNNIKGNGIDASGSYHYDISQNNEIPQAVFFGCYLRAISIPNSVTTIGNGAFCNCRGLTSISIPNSVTSIGNYAFRECSGLTSISIPNSVTSIGNYAFYGCSGLTSIKVESGNNVYDSRNNCNAIIKKSTNELIAGCKNTVIPNSVTSIGSYAFYGCSGLISISIPNSVTSIGSDAFSGCSGLISISIPNSVTSIGFSAFSGCNGLTSMSIPNSVTSIGSYAFNGCRGLTSMSIPNSVTGIGDGAFWGCSGLTSIKVESGNTIYDSRNNCNAIIRKSNNELIAGCKNTVIPNSVTSIGKSAFLGCRGLTSISIPNSVTSIGEGAFYYCSGLTSMSIPNSVTSIGISAFSECSGLASISIPNSVMSIGKYAFRGCSGLKDIITEIKTPFEINENVFSVYSTATLTVPNGTKSAYQSTASWNKFTNIVEASGDNSSTKRTIHVATAGTLRNLISESEKYTIEELTLTGELNGTDFRLLRDMAGNNYLGRGTSGKLKVLDLTNTKIVAGGEKYLDTNTFNGKDINGSGSYHYDISQNNIIPQAVFLCCHLEEIHIPNSVTGIENDAFFYCSGLTSISIPNSVTSIGNSAFYHCSGLTSISIPNSVTSIGNSAFQSCSGLTSIKVESGNTIYDSRNNCNAIIRTSNNELIAGCKNTVIPNSVTSIGNWAFSYCSGLTSISIPNSVTRIGIYAFYCCSGLTSISIPNSVTSIGDFAFSGCSGLASISIPNSVTSIGRSAFSGCSGLKDIISEIKTPFEINEYVFSVYSTATLTVPNGTKSAYQSTAGWNKFSNIVEKESEQSITITVKSYTREYGDANPNFEYTVSGGAISGAPKITCSATKTSSVGTYTIKIEKGSITNSNVTFVDGTLTITMAPLTITAKSYTRKQGEANPTFEVTYSGFKNGETSSVLTKKPTCSTAATPSSSPGTYDITVSGASATNYNISYVKGKLTVTQADAVIVTARNYTREYGEANPTFGYTTSGATLNGTPTITCSATKYSAVGTYPIKIAQGSVSNYNVTYVEGTLTITKAPLTITAKSYTRKQGEANPTFDVTYSGFKNGETSSVLTQKPICSTTATPSSSPGTYDITVSGAFATNYDISYVKGKLTVTKADAVTVTARNYTREYGEANPSFGYTTSGATLNGTPSITCSATKTSPVGTYPIKIAQGSVSNYNVTYVEGTLTITKAPLTIIAKSYTREEGQNNPTFEVTYSGFKNGETESVLTRKPSVSTEATTSSPIGTYDLVPYGAQANNYNMYYYNGTLTITEKSAESVYYDGITYFCTNATRTAEVRSVDNGLMSVVIPYSISYKGKAYEVISIGDGALSNRTFDYVSLPSTISSISSSTFYNSMLGALIWYANSSLSSSVFTNMAMPTNSNFLLYVNSKSCAPSNVSNVVVGSVASKITLEDGKDTRFYCPKAFTAQTISYTHHYGMTTGGNGKGWETIALPFDVQRIEHKTKGVLTPFALYSDMMTQRPFWLYELGSNGFRKTDAIRANTPYIIAMPNDPKYDDEYILAGDVTFSATNATVVETTSVSRLTSNGKKLVPAFAVVNSASSVYPLNVNNNLISYNGSYDAGSRFISNLRATYPFEAYMTTSSSAARSLTIEFEDEVTGIDEIPLKEQRGGIVKVYTLTGLLMFSVPQSEFAEKWQRLPSGVYIVNGRKMIKSDDAQYNIVQ